MKYPIIHIYGAIGARAAVLHKFPNARSVRTIRRGDKFPIYEIKAGTAVLGEGDGVTNAWEETAIKLWNS